MNYYVIRQPSDKKIIGINDGGEQAEIIESKWKDKQELKRYINEYILGIGVIQKKLRAGEIVNPPVIEYIKERPKAILTDFLSFCEGYAGGRWLVSQKVKDIIEHFNTNVKFYSTIGLYSKDIKIEGYSNLHILPLYSKEAFDFPNCVFYRGSKLAGNKTTHIVNDYDEYVKSGLVFIDVLSLYKNVLSDIDLFTFDIHPMIYVSERLKNAFEQAGVTGVRFYEPSEPELKISLSDI